MVADSDINLSKLDVILEGFAAETSNEYKYRTVNYQSSQSEINIDSSGSVMILRDGEEVITASCERGSLIISFFYFG